MFATPEFHHDAIANRLHMRRTDSVGRRRACGGEGERPKDFASAKDSKMFLVTYKRQK